MRSREVGHREQAEDRGEPWAAPRHRQISQYAEAEPEGGAKPGIDGSGPDGARLQGEPQRDRGHQQGHSTQKRAQPTLAALAGSGAQRIPSEAGEQADREADRGPGFRRVAEEAQRGDEGDERAVDGSVRPQGDEPGPGGGCGEPESVGPRTRQSRRSQDQGHHAEVDGGEERRGRLLRQPKGRGRTARLVPAHRGGDLEESSRMQRPERA